MLRENITAANVRTVSRISLLRVLAHIARAMYERVYRVPTRDSVRTFLFDISSFESTADTHERIIRLLDYISKHERTTAERLNRMKNDAHTWAVWKRANRGGGSLKRTCADRDSAVAA